MFKIAIWIALVLSLAWQPLNAQDRGPTDQQIREWNKAELELAGLKLHIPAGFTRVVNPQFSYWLLDKNGTIFTVFKDLYLNKDTSIAIGIYFSGNHDIDGMRDFRERAPNLVSNRVDTIRDDYLRLDKEYLAKKWSTDYGVSFRINLRDPFMGRFIKNRMIYIANKTSDVRVVCFYQDSVSVAADQLMTRRPFILEPD